ncbi:hypothetical protein HK097_007013 [Rhizophlyctis rosea]|uniref:CRAL-TRIO domain-containing protein n=1 Tax=Rhizophlyctis rosea TaxID=64517 RepID=A0AAD5SC73_9FUNG|nr:hypothetical protein HK097_007013 [Rhizophlyctis rosea]
MSTSGAALKPPHDTYPSSFPPVSQEQSTSLATIRSRIETDVVPATFTPPEKELAKQWLDDACLRRYLVAHKGNVEAAVKGLKETVVWRKEYKVSSIRADEVKSEAVSGCNYFNGFDRAGRPIIYLKKKATSENPELNVRLLVYTIETAIKAMPQGIEKLHIIMDFTLYTRANSPPLHISRLTLSILQNHYPERLGRCHMVNAPWVFSLFWNMFSPFVDPITREKIKFVTLTKGKAKEGEKSPILEDVEEGMLEVEYGGKNGFVYDHDAYWRGASEAALI